VRMTDQGGHLFTWGFGLYKNKIDAVGRLEPPKAPPTTTTDQNGRLVVTTDSGETKVAAPDNNRGALPTIAMAVSAITLLGFVIWRIRRRYARPAAVSAPGSPDSETTIRIDRIRD
jgi:D-alanyl-D-alanine carboxypeptidase (penicillin-binding protein 5/6)